MGWFDSFRKSFCGTYIEELDNARVMIAMLEDQVNDLEVERDIIAEIPGLERPSPQDWLPISAITVNKKQIQSSLGLSQEPLVWMPEIPDTNSMDGVFDYGNNNILIAGAIPEDHKKIVDRLSVGDIAVYQVYPDDYTIGYAIHRVIDINQDDEGEYYTFRGDNNASIDDPWKVRPNMVQYISVGTIY